MIKNGIDVSEHQGVIDWNKVNTDFVIIRAGYGREISQIDKQFENNYKGCKGRGIPCGAYWYSYATTPEDAKKEAAACLEVLKGKQFEYPIYFDVEEQVQFLLGKTAVSNIIKAFLDTVEKAGYWVGLYMSQFYLETYVTEDIRNRYAIWVAQYASKCTYNGRYGIWQYSIAGNEEWDIINKKAVSGINGECDLDYCYIDYPTQIKAAGLNGFEKKPTSVTPPKTTKMVTLTIDDVTYEGTLTKK